MRRYHLIELHEQPWYPAFLRKLFQSAIGRGSTAMGALDNALVPFRRLLEKTRPDKVLDLCSGSGELAVDFWRKTIATFDEPYRPKIVVSDLYPNEEAYARLRQADPETVDYYPTSVNALRPPEDAPRVRTLLVSLHHFRPHQAREILEDAARNADGIAIFEITQRTWKAHLQVLIMAPLVSVFVTLFLVRPFRLRQLVWGLLIPVIPLTTVLDALVSNLRTYTVEELKSMTSSIRVPGFEWEVGIAEAVGLGGVETTYLLGWRSAPA
jgi:hypothetical protein